MLKFLPRRLIDFQLCGRGGKLCGRGGKQVVQLLKILLKCPEF